MNPKERMQEAYDRIATDYIAQYSEVAPVVVDWGLRFLSRVGQGARVLDVGCGPGRYMAWMESRGMTVVGVDLSAGMLAEARSRVRGDLRQMDMSRVALVDGY